MRPEFRTYLRQIGIAGDLATRVNSLLTVVEGVIPAKIEDIFVSELRTPDSARQYLGIWSFGASFISELDGFVSQAQFDCVPLKNNINRYEVSWNEYDFKKANDKSQMNVSIQMGVGGIIGALYASGSNCTHLRDIVRKYLAPNALL